MDSTYTQTANGTGAKQIINYNQNYNFYQDYHITLFKKTNKSENKNDVGKNLILPQNYIKRSQPKHKIH